MTVVEAGAEAEAVQPKVSRSDFAIEEDIWSGLWHEDTIRTLDFNSILVEVDGGKVVMRGHVGKDSNRNKIGEIVAAVPGVIEVDNQIVSDQDLTLKIAQALSDDERTRPYFPSVTCMHGWVTIIGEVPSLAAREVVEEIVSAVPEVRGILNPPSVGGQTFVQDRTIAQPDIGAQVYAWEGLIGRVTSVVTNPLDRLVTHFVIVARGEAAGRRVTSHFVLPVKTIEVINDGNIILSDDVRRITAYPELDLEEFPMAPEDWRPPFPYKSGQVHWRAY
ncbi:MAG TPA: BON domain-containing protein [Anaerolineales bacterium]